MLAKWESRGRGVRRHPTLTSGPCETSSCSSDWPWSVSSSRAAPTRRRTRTRPRAPARPPPRHRLRRPRRQPAPTAREVAGSRNTLALVAILAACSRDYPPSKPATEPDPLAPLRAFEQERRAQAKFVEAETSDRTFGADPYDLVALAEGHFAGVLRGRDAV